MQSESATFSAASADYDQDVACRVCGSANAKFICETPNEHGVVDTIRNYSCRDCGIAFVGNRFTHAELGAAYATLGSGEYYKEIRLENREKMRTATMNLKKFADADSAIIDIGTGNGEFIRVLTEYGFTNVSGHEIPNEDLEEVSDLAAALYQDHDYSSVPSGQFDVVTLLDVVEHVPDPQFLMDQCFRMLKPGGHIYFHTPVVTRTDRAMHRLAKLPGASKIAKAWLRARTSIFHLQNYSEHGLRMLLDRAGFVLKSFQVKNELSWPVAKYVQVYLVDKLGMPSFTKQALVPAVYPLIATNFFNANKSIVLAQKPRTAPE